MSLDYTKNLLGWGRVSGDTAFCTHIDIKF